MTLAAEFVSPAQGSAAKPLSDRPDTLVIGIDRWAFRVNALELLCTVPNINAEFDLSSSAYDRYSIGLTAKYNWDTRHSVAPSMVFNMFEIRPEFRWWFRKKNEDDDDGAASAKKKPALEGAFFTGGYLHGGSYSIKAGTYGIQGLLFGFGGTFGYDFPLYSYRHFAIDFELGVSAGFVMTSYNCYTMNRNNTDYVSVPERSRGFHLCFYPVVSELKACFVFRTLSIKDKYKKVNLKKLQEKQEAAERMAQEKEATKAAKAQQKADAAKERERLKAEEKAKREEEKRIKAEEKAKLEEEKAKLEEENRLKAEEGAAAKRIEEAERKAAEKKAAGKNAAEKKAAENKLGC